MPDFKVFFRLSCIVIATTSLVHITHADERGVRLTELASSLSRDIEGKGKLSAMYLCEAQTNCGGLIFDEGETGGINDDEEVEYSKVLTVPLHFEDKDDKDQGGNGDKNSNVFISSKSWLIQRGAVMIPAHAVSSTILHTDYDITIEEARNRCQLNQECVAFSFPLQSENSLTRVDEVIYVNSIAQFDYGPEHLMQYFADSEEEDIYVPDIEWITHIFHDRKRLMGRIPRHLDLKQSQWSSDSTTPYRPCCSMNAKLPTIEELKEADSLERIDCSISREEFFEKYEKPRIPVILLGCTKDWKARQFWSSFDTIQSRFQNDTLWEFQSITKDEQSGELLPSEQKTGVKITWGEFQEFYAKVKADPNYGTIRMMRKLERDDYITEELKKDYDVPSPFEGADLYEKLPRFHEHFFPKGIGMMAYFIMGEYCL